MIAYDDPITTEIRTRSAAPVMPADDPVMIELPVRSVPESVVYEGNGKGRASVNTLMRKLLEVKP